MSRLLKTYFVVIFLLGATLFGAAPAQASLTADAAFGSLMGTTTIDQGGAIHSQARSIYSLGGGQISVQGKRISLLQADGPSLSAGCGGISWHFGGFAFISMDELRQMVEAISQAALGVAVDLAMQTLCPQCYAVMSKLREMANAMRNAAADSCSVAQAVGRTIVSQLGGTMPSTTAISTCSSGTAGDGESASYMNSAAGTLCRGLDAANSYLTEAGNYLMGWLNGDRSGNTPNSDLLSKSFNAQYEMLTALGYQDGLVKDLMLNLTGLTIYYPKPDVSCQEAFQNFKGTKLWDDALQSDLTRPQGDVPADSDGEPKASDAKMTPATPDTTGSSKTNKVCYAPPTLGGISDVAKRIICGLDPNHDLQLLTSRVPGSSSSQWVTSSLGRMCQLDNPDSQAFAATPPDLLLYTCNEKETARCMQPHQATYSQLVKNEGASGYTGLGWLLADALYRGVNNVALNKPLEPETIALLNGSSYPLYRLVNLAAVYPGTAQQLLNSYIATIAIERASQTINALTRPGALSAISLQGQSASIPLEWTMQFRQTLYNMFRDGGAFKDEALKFNSERQVLVQSIVNVNRALQSEVFSSSIMGNADLAVSIKDQLTAAASLGGKP